MRSCRIELMAAILALTVVAVVAISADRASAAAPSVAWSLRSVAEPTSFSHSDVEEELVQVAVSATGGTFKLIVEGDETSPIAYNATPSEVRTVVNALASVGGVGGSVAVTGGRGDSDGAHPYAILFSGSLVGKNVSVEGDASGLTGGKQSAEVKFERSARFVDQYTLTLTNVGSRNAEGIVTLVDTLPRGVTTSEEPSQSFGGVNEWACSSAPGTEENAVVTCTSTSPIPALTPATALSLHVNTSGASGIVTNHVQVSGGIPGCGEAGQSRCPSASVSSSTPLGAPQSAFEVLNFSAGALDRAGLLDMQAGDHPGAYTSAFEFPTASRAVEGDIDAYPVEEAKQIIVDLPPGIIGDAEAAPTCSLLSLSEQGRCPPATAVGTLMLINQGAVQGEGGAETSFIIYNIAPEHGYPAEFGVFDETLRRAALMFATLRGGPERGVRVITQNLPQGVVVSGVSATFFGNPAVKDASGNPPVPFLTNSSSCGSSSLTTTIYVDSWQHQGRVFPDGQPDLSDPNWKSASSGSPPVTGCEGLQFHPTFSFAPEESHSQADEPSGYESTLIVPQNEDPNGLATPPLKTAVVTLPAGVAISPAAADGLVGCQEAGSEGIELDSNKPGHCPAASTVGSVEVVTPLLKEVLKGSVFVAQPACGGSGQPACTEEAAETGGVFALYLEVGSENSGIHIKLKGKVEVGGSGHHNGLEPGQVRAAFAETPQQPFSELKLKFNGGPRAPLANPQTCGSFQTAAELEPWSHKPAPGEREGTPNVTLNPAFTIAGCENRFAPGFSAGMVNPQAGSYSPFTLTFSRQDREQDLAGLTVNMPQGLLGKIAGIAQCGEGEANVGICSAASRVGSAAAAAGSGSHPFWQSGNVYLTGPYKGAPFGLSVVVPAKAGPFNLGNIVVRAAIHIDPHTAQVTVVSDPLPQMVDGVPLRVQTVNVTIDRPGFTFNPTSCEPMQVSGTLTGTGGASVPVTSRFQAANCASLPFKPGFTVSTQGRTSKANGASLTVRVTQKPGEANIHKVDLQLPLILPARLTTLQKACTEAQFNANPAGCPSASVIGTATAITPVLSVPLTGPAYLVSHGGAAFPDVEFVLQGQGVTIVLDGGTDIKKGITYSRFETVPDAPISSFETILPEGPHSALAANGDLCAQTRVVTVRKRVLRRIHGRTRHLTRSVREVTDPSLSMPTTITGQNGAQIKQNTKIDVTGCARHKAKARKAKGHGKGKRKRRAIRK